jgi:hypothetical protein
MVLFGGRVVYDNKNDGDKDIPEKGRETLEVFPKWDKIRNAPDLTKKTHRILDKVCRQRRTAKSLGFGS